MTFTRLALLLAGALLLMDKQIGNGQLIQSLSVQATELGYTLNDTFSKVARRISP
jgi:hypothetical protein